jgi:ABC-type amino acid transport substrate-binding protein
MTDAYLTELLHVVEHGAEPDPAFLDRLYDELATDLGFRARHIAVRAAPSRSRAWWLLAAALLIMALASTALIAGAAVRLLQEPRPSDVLDTIRERGVIQVVVRDGFPQARSPEGAMGGFDIDVANEIARRLGVMTDIRPEPDPVAPIAPDADLAVVSRAGHATAGRHLVSSAIYFWPVHVVVLAGAPAASVGELDGSTICVVAGTSGEAWLAGGLHELSATPIQRPPDAAAMTRPDDESCLDALVDGSVAAALTADLGPAELAVRGGIRALDGPVLTEERGFIVDREAGDVDALLEAIDAAIEAARADGTLSDLARSRFGGHDLSAPPPLAPQEE